MFLESCMRWLRQKFMWFFSGLYTCSIKKTGMTSLKSLLHDSEAGQSQASSIMCIFFCTDTQVHAHPFQAYAHTHIQCDQNLDFMSIWGFTKTSVLLNRFAGSFMVCMCIFIWTSVKRNKRYKFWQHNQNSISMEIWDWWGCFPLVSAAENPNLS